MNLRVATIRKNLRAQGPGIRYSIWVQGCSIHCPGCSNTDKWNFDGGVDLSVDDLVYDILNTKNIDGITITGGEPLDQYPAVLDLCKKIFGKKSIFITTGYWTQDIIPKQEILNFVDIICTGPFDANQICIGDWKGSLNQSVTYLTPLGVSQKDYPKVLKEVEILENGDAIERGFSINFSK